MAQVDVLDNPKADPSRPYILFERSRKDWVKTSKNMEIDGEQQWCMILSISV
jgi:hypothetical protein